MYPPHQAHRHPTPLPPPVAHGRLPEHRSDWPAAARDAYHHLLAELNAWCRDLGRSSAGNDWIAEVGVRQAWLPTTPAPGL